MKGEFYKMDFRAWNTGTIDLTLEQEAAYLRLCHAMYDIRGPIPESTRLLQSIFRCGNVKAAALVKQLVAAGKIERVAGGKLSNKRVMSELQDREKVSDARRVSGQKGGSAPRVTSECTPSDLRVPPECTPSEVPVTPANPLKQNDLFEAIASGPGSREEERREDTPIVPKGTEAKKASEPEGFAEFWDAFPKRKGGNPRSLAARRYEAALKAGATPGSLLAAGKVYAAEQAGLGKVGTMYVKQVCYWLSPDIYPEYVARVEKQREKDEARKGFVANLSDDIWNSCVKKWKKTGGMWLLADRSPPPDHPQTKVPARILAEFNIHPERQRAA